MAEHTGIGWCDHTANFWWGCLKLSPACDHCYALALSKRTGHDIWGPPKTTARREIQSTWKELLKWDRKAEEDGVRRRVFVNSMSDFFEDHPQVEPLRNAAFPLLESLENLDALLLTKRIENVERMVPAAWMHGNWPDHVWMGTSVENQEYADLRILKLLPIPAKIRWLSLEPMLGPIDWRWSLCNCPWPADAFRTRHLLSCPLSFYGDRRGPEEWPIHWVVVGGESGPGCRPMQIDWMRAIRDQCQDAGVPFFAKQLGGFPDKRDQLEDLPADLCIREWPASATHVADMRDGVM